MGLQWRLNCDYARHVTGQVSLEFVNGDGKGRSINETTGLVVFVFVIIFYPRDPQPACPKVPERGHRHDRHRGRSNEPDGADGVLVPGPRVLVLGSWSLGPSVMTLMARRSGRDGTLRGPAGWRRAQPAQPAQPAPHQHIRENYVRLQRFLSVQRNDTHFGARKAAPRVPLLEALAIKCFVLVSEVGSNTDHTGAFLVDFNFFASMLW